MEKLQVKETQIEFADLSKEAQIKLYRKDKVKFEKEAAVSAYESVRELVLKDKNVSSEALDEMFTLEINSRSYHQFEKLNKIWSHPNFKKDDEKRKMLTISRGPYILLKDATTPSAFLKEMMEKELSKMFPDSNIVGKIITHKNFQMEEKTKIRLARSDQAVIRRMLIKEEEISSELLNEILRGELNEGFDYAKAIKSILSHKNFEMEEKTENAMMNCHRIDIIRIFLKYPKTSSANLNKIMRGEAREEYYYDSTIMNLIVKNTNFKMEEETRKKLASSKNWRYRLIAVKDEGTSLDFLKEMQAKETVASVKKEIESRTSKGQFCQDRIYEILERVRNNKEEPIAKAVEQIMQMIN